MKNYQVVLDFLINLKSDPAKVNAVVAELEKGNKKFNLNIDTEKFKENLNSAFTILDKLEAEIKKASSSELNLKIDPTALDKIQKEIKDVVSGLGDIDLTKFEKSLNSLDPGDLDKVRNSLKDAFENFDTHKLNAAMQKAGQDFTQLKKDAQDALNAQQGVVLKLARSGNKDSDEYRTAVDELKKRREVLNQIKAKEDEIHATVKGIADIEAKPTKGLTDKLAAFGLAAQGIEQFTSTINQFQEPFIELDKQVRNIGTLGVKNFGDFADAATEMSKTVPDSAGAIAEGVYDAISAGTIKVTDGMANIGDGMKFVETASKLATAGLTSTKDSINGLTSVMNAYGLESGKAAEVADLFFGAVNVGKTTIPELNASLSQVIPTAAAFGVGFDQVSAAIATMTKQGTPTAQATTQIRAALVELAKPGATLAPIMQKAGVSLDSLKKEGLQESLKKLGIAMEASGKSATQVFSSVEAAGAVMLLSGKNAQMASDDFKAVAGSIGSTDAAFAIASDGIGAKGKILENKIQAVANSIYNSMGSIGTQALSAGTKFAPLITSFAGMATLIPTEPIKRLKEMGSSIAALGPQLLSFVKAQEGATAAQKIFNLVANLNPYLLAITGVVASLAILKLIAGALKVTAEEKLNDNKASQESINTQIQLNEKQQLVAKNSIGLVEQFKKQGDAAMGNASLLLKLSDAYPGVIDKSKSYETNLNNLEKASQGSQKELGNLSSSMFKLQSQSLELKVNEAKLNLEVKREDIEKQVAESMGGWRYTVSAFLNIDGKWVADAKALTKGYTDAIDKATTDSDIAKATTEFQMAIFNDKKFKEMTKEQKLAMIKSVEDYGEERKKARDAEGKGIEKDIKNHLALGHSQGQILDFIQQKYGKSKEDAKKILETQEKQTKETKETAKAVDTITAAMGKQLSATKEGYDANLKTVENYLIAKKLKKDVTEQDTADYKKAQNQLTGQTNELKTQQAVHQAVTEQYKIQAEKAKTLDEVLSKKFEGEKKSIDNTKENLDLDQRMVIAIQGRTKNTYDEIVAQENSTKATQDKLQALKDIYKVTQNADGTLNIGVKIKETEKEKIKNDINGFVNDLKKDDVTTVEMKSKLVLEDAQYQEKLAEFKKQQLDYQISIGFANPEAMVTLLESERNDIMKKLQANQENKLLIETKISASTDSKEITELNGQLLDINNKILDNQNKSFAKSKEISDRKNTIYTDETQKIKDELEKQSRLIEDNDQLQAVALTKFLDNYQNSWSSTQDRKLNDQSKKFEKQQSDELAMLEAQKQRGLFTEENYEKEKEKIADSYAKKKLEAEETLAKKKMVMETTSKALTLFNETDKNRKQYELQIAATSQQMKLLDAKRVFNEKTGKYEFLNKEDKKANEELVTQFDNLTDLLNEKGDKINVVLTETGTAISDVMGSWFAGDNEGMLNNMRKFLAVMVAYLQQGLSGVVTDLVFKWLTIDPTSKALPTFTKLALIPVMQGVISAAVKGLTDPIFNSMLSFSTGGRIDSPTMAIIGDGAKLGSDNREWIFRDDQLIKTIQMASVNSNSTLLDEVRRLNGMLAGQTLEATLSGNDILISLRRTEYSQASRSK